MAASEFDIIERYFTWAPSGRREIVLGVGDDAAEVALPAGARLLLDVSQIREHQEFQRGDDAGSVAHRLLADAAVRSAARGATPIAFTLALSLPAPDAPWLEGFSTGLADLARTHDIALIGGDTTRGPRSAVLHMHALLAPGIEPLSDRNAASGDLIYVAGRFGDAGLAVLHEAGELQLPRRERQLAEQALRYPVPELPAAGVIAGLASSAAAIRQTLAKDLEQLLTASGCGATIQVQRLPLGAALHANLDRAGGWNVALHGPALGQLCFTVPESAQVVFEQRIAALGQVCTWIGMVERNQGLRYVMDDGSEL